MRVRARVRVRVRVRANPSPHPNPNPDQGRVEPQDEGSQLIALLLGAQPGELVADYCAGAGGKTLALAAAMGNRGRLWAMDIDERRLASGAPRCAKAGSLRTPD